MPPKAGLENPVFDFRDGFRFFVKFSIMCCAENNLPDEYDDDCYDFDIIEESIFEIDFYEYNIDDYWARAWTINDEGFYRADWEIYNNREYRAYPTRYRLGDFTFSKSLRRTLKKNADLKIVIRPFRPTEGKDDLLTAHKQIRFKSEKERHSLRNNYQYLKYAPIELMETAVFKGEKLVACSVFMVSEHSVAGNFAFWDPHETARGLGILTVLLEVRYAIERGKEFYYLGDYIKQNPNYQYKTRFPGLELWDWDNENWVDYKSGQKRLEEMFKHRFRCRDDLERDPVFTVSLLETATQHTPNVIASALVGSRARGTEHEDSDYDVMILTDDIDSFFNDGDQLARRFHRWRETKIEDRGAVKTQRAFYRNGNVFEFNFVPPSWAKIDPVDEGTRRVVAEGMKILYDPQGILEKLQAAILDDEKNL